MKNVLYSNYYDSDRFDEAKQYLAEDLECELDEVSDDQVWDQLNWEDQLNWDDCEDILKEIDQRAPAFVFVAEVHTRYPEFYGYSHLSGCYKYTEHSSRAFATSATISRYGPRMAACSVNTTTTTAVAPSR